MLNNKYNTDKVNEFLDYLMNLSYNKKCADCGKSNPSWADLTHSFFICYECSALHRRLGAHRSRVKSAQMDSWTTEELRRMHVGGNKYSHKITQNSDFSIRYKDTKDFTAYLDEKERQSRANEPEDSFMNRSRQTSLKRDMVVVEKKPKPKFSDWIESSDEENDPKSIENTLSQITQEEEDDVGLVVSKPGSKIKKSVKPSRSPFSFSVKEHQENEINDEK
ncbi:uncharacterized protein VICG_01192 [Vittaforma corneae ATCC 50505]|uniref:Arf-GAP domain-containing protein n=1 Tax=Vittaforma corneae (strain ATCC 50505) TaxID=993615 RepID=L2GMV7_VITCO|nr:uncharacterized protein VICG_01192 [Vittaforma corneae ATCC 50505]ELA41840.1 hypothetical protein VICG_01192 [Vittaforma corneae ATCC 50505]